ncbi:MAG: Spy/CpxP family protein refolding chaperone [Flavobacteriales bacterium]|nr:Spy/CpxP family protein refolding chaperone [Flavobacteriales bacterium]
MKKLTFIATLVVSIFTVNSVKAQSNISKAQPMELSAPDDNEPDHFESFKDQLNLTPEQKAKIKAIREKHSTERNELKAKLKALRETERAEISEVLTPEQRALVKEKMEKRKAEREAIKENRPNGGRPGPKHK